MYPITKHADRTGTVKTIAARRGHDVTIIEKSEVLGGEMILAGATPYKEDVKKALSWYRDEVGRAGVKVLLNTEADYSYINSFGADKVVLAMGYTFTAPRTNKISGIPWGH